MSRARLSRRCQVRFRSLERTRHALQTRHSMPHKFAFTVVAASASDSNQQVIGPGFLWRRLKKEINLPGTVKVLGCGFTYMLLFIIFQITFDESYTAPFWSDRLHEIMFLPPLSPYSKILLLWGQGILNTLMLLPFFILFLREKIELTVVLGSLTFVVADFAPAFANFHRIEPLLLLDQVFIGFCLQFMFVATAAFCFGRNQQKLQTKNFSKKPLPKQKTLK